MSRQAAIGVFVLLTVLLGVIPAAAQTAATGTVVGIVADPSAAVIPGAQVELKDEATGATRSTRTNSSGQYTLTSVTPGRYTITVTSEGFQRTVLTSVSVEVAKSALVNLTLQPGTVEQVVEVVGGARAELQTIDATIGDVVDARSLVDLPTVTRRAIELVFLQVGAQPWTGWAGNGSSGVVAGGRPDQNTFMLDGMDVSDTQVGGTCCGNIGMGIPIPVESISEFRANITNQNATFNRSPGGQFTLSTRRGTNAFHGAAYWYHRNDNVNANTWFRNFFGQENPELKDNRYGFRVGGPLLKEKLFFFINMEQRRFPQQTDVRGLVPTDSLRQGILRFRDAAGNVVSYNLASSTLCGAAGTSACDPRGIGISPIVSQHMALIPAGNDPTGGDGLNTIALRGPTKSDQENDNVVARLDYNISSRWRTALSWAWAQNRFFSPNLNPGIDWRGGPNNIQTTASIPNDPYMYNLSVIGEITPTFVSETRVGFNQSTIQFLMPDPEVLVTGAGTALDLVGMEEPFQIAGSRAQLGISRTWQLGQNFTWIRGPHSFQFGGNYQHLWFYHSRSGAVPLHVSPIATIGGTGFTTLGASSRPPTCATAGQANCLQPGDVARWDNLYAATLGLVDTVGLFAVRDQQGNDLAGTPRLINDGVWHNLQVYINDTWRVTNAFTLSLGVNGMMEVPYEDTEGRRHFLIQMDSGQPLSVNGYLRRRELAARLGRGYNPGLAYAPIQFYPERREFPLHKSLSPAIAAAWNPNFSEGILGSLFGSQKTVFRGGYRLAFHRPMAVGFVQFSQIGDSAVGTPHTLNAPDCDFNGSPGAGCNPASTDPAISQLRVGVDGPVPNPNVPAQIGVPFVPEIPFSNPTRLHWDPHYKYGYVHSVNFTIQREMPSDVLLEVGYIGRFGRRLELSKNINAVPFFIADMSGSSSQTFAQAFDAVAVALRTGGAVTPQPWFENNLGAGSTATLAASNTADFVNGFVNNLWLNAIDPGLVALGGEGAAINNRQIRQTISHTYGGWNNYNAFFTAVNKRFSQGLTFSFNYTLSKNLDTLGAIADSAGGMTMNPYDLRYAYGPALSDRTHGINAHWVYELPFGAGKAFGASGVLDKIIGGWQTSGVFTYFTGVPMFVTQGGQPFGSFIAQESAPLVRDPNAQEGRNTGVSGSGGVGTAGDPATGGTGLNLFGDPENVYNSFRFFLISQDTRSSRGVIRGLSRWTTDMSFAKNTQVTERVNVRLNFDFLNIFNHPLFLNPSLDLLNPGGFGVITGQPGDPGNGDYWAPRQVQLGLRVEF